jgi:hypothetical protein
MLIKTWYKVPGTGGPGLLECSPDIKNEAEAIKTNINSIQAAQVSIATKAKTSAQSTKSEFDKLYKCVSAAEKYLPQSSTA